MIYTQKGILVQSDVKTKKRNNNQ